MRDNQIYRERERERERVMIYHPVEISLKHVKHNQTHKKNKHEIAIMSKGLLIQEIDKHDKRFELADGHV